MTSAEQIEPRPLSGGAVMAAASRISVTVAGGLTTLVLARVIGPGGFGTYSVARAIVPLLATATTLGVEHGITYFVSTGGWAARTAHLTVLKLSAITGVAGAAVGLGVRALIPSAFAGLTVALTALTVTGLPFALVWLYTTYIALATDRYESYVLLSLLQAALTLALTTSGALVFGLGGAVGGMTASTLIVGLGSAVWGLRLPKGEGASGELRRAISFGLKGYAANALQLVNYRLDLFILSAVTSAAAVGWYSTAAVVTALLWVVPMALSDVLFPRVAHLNDGEQDVTLEMVETKSLRHAGLITAVTALLLVGVLELLLVPVLGANFRPAIDLGLILLPGSALIGISPVLSSSVVGRGKPVYSLYVSLITTPLTIILFVVFIPWLKDTGAALASSLSYLSTFALFCFFYRRVTGRRVLPLLLPGRSELEDLRAVPRAAKAWTGNWRR